MSIPEIIPVWQPIGYSSHLIAKRIAEIYRVKTSHTGTLDPMAEGVLIVLTGEDRLKKYDYAHWLKTYEFEMVLGLQTDTYDGMGLFTTSSTKEEVSEIIPVLHSFVGEYEQTVPSYSTIKVQGKHLHEYARDGDENSTVLTALPKRKGEILALNLLETSTINAHDLATSLITNINKVAGDFRQDKIIDQWESFLNKNKTQEYTVLKCKVQMTKGLYVRSLVMDIASKLNTVAFTKSIIRTDNGAYNSKNSISLEKLFE